MYNHGTPQYPKQYSVDDFALQEYVYRKENPYLLMQISRIDKKANRIECTWITPVSVVVGMHEFQPEELRKYTVPQHFWFCERDGKGRAWLNILNRNHRMTYVSEIFCSFDNHAAAYYMATQLNLNLGWTPETIIIAVKELEDITDTKYPNQ